MSSLVSDVVLVVAIVTNGLVAGLLFIFWCAIRPAFYRLDDAAYVRAFRAINATIVNAWFLPVFLGAAASGPVYVVLQLGTATAALSPWAVAGAICSILSFGITAGANLALNRELDRAPITTTTEFEEARWRFEEKWNRWNLARTIASVGALGFFAVAAVAG